MADILLTDEEIVVWAGGRSYLLLCKAFQEAIFRRVVTIIEQRYMYGENIVIPRDDWQEWRKAAGLVE